VNQHNVRYNAGHNTLHNANGGELRPVITVKTSKANHKANSVFINGPSRVVYSPDKPLSCGAKVWIETKAPVVLDEEQVIG
jgi:hypothetical protein